MTSDTGNYTYCRNLLVGVTDTKQQHRKHLILGSNERMLNHWLYEYKECSVLCFAHVIIYKLLIPSTLLNT